jgi:acetyl/propionyl-CoA carboxylase alpha subunit
MSAPRGRRHIRRLFVANRGEIAARIAATARKLRIEPLLPAVAAPGEAVAGGAVDLLDPSAVVRAALAADADAVHPGYGFLAESPVLAEAVIDAGLTWVGPPPQAARQLGDKAAARAVAQAAGVPVAPGEEPDDQSDRSLTAAARRIGLPVVLKPVAGGGGKGIRIVRAMGELETALAGARREAARSFNDERLIVERYLHPARHVEVQVLGDEAGAVVHLGDRDCSLQRRQQKILEEAPAPGLPAGRRAAIRDAAVRIASAVGYRNAGTCEFLVADDGAWAFLEMNARLQVEHPVTELVLGRDLVADQLRLAEGARLGELGLEQAAIDRALARGGHAIEVRINAEDPQHGFLPSAGTVAALRWPSGASSFEAPAPRRVRIDSALAEGEVVGGAFDPLVAKVIARGRGRGAALDLLARALDETEVLGVVTNLGFLRRLVRLPVVREGQARIDTVETLAPLPPAPLPDAAWRAAARLLGAARTGEPWAAGWRLNAPAALRLRADGSAGEEARSVPLEVGGSPLEDQPIAVRDGATAFVSVDGRSTAFTLAAAPDVDRVARPTSSLGADRGGGGAIVASPMPGRVLAIHVVAGQAVEGGSRIATIEAMKMEHVVTATSPGRVTDLLVLPGAQVTRGQPLVRVEPGR